MDQEEKMMLTDESNAELDSMSEAISATVGRQDRGESGML